LLRETSIQKLPLAEREGYFSREAGANLVSRERVGYTETAVHPRARIVVRAGSAERGFTLPLLMEPL
jgi:hypothetical protein